jgi:hypothetical protein
MAGRQQVLGNVHADKTCRSCYQNLHSSFAPDTLLL